MKRARYILILLLALSLLSVVFLVACEPSDETPDEIPNGEQYTVTVQCDTAKGAATLSPQVPNNKYDKGASVTLTVSAEEGYTVGEVTLNGTAVNLTDGKYTFTVEGDTAIAVTFEDIQPVEQYTVTVQCDTTQGTATLSPQAPNNKYDKGTSVTLTVSAEEGYIVEEVTLNGTAVTLIDNKHTFTVEGNTAIVVSFAEDEPDPSAPQNLWGNYEGTGNGKQYAIEIEEYNITVTVDDGAPVQCPITKVNDSYYIFVYFMYNNAEHHIEYSPGGDAVRSFEFYKGEFDFICECTRVSVGGGDDPEPGEKSLERFWGKFEGESDDGKQYTIEIEEYYITITVDEGTPVKCAFTFVNNDRYDSKLYFNYDGAQHCAEYDDFDSPVQYILLFRESPYKYIGSFNRVDTGDDDEGGGNGGGNGGNEPDQSVTIDDERIGTYTGTDADGKVYVIKLEKNRALITVDGNEPVICYYLDKSVSYDIYFMWEGEEYDIVFGRDGIYLYANNPYKKIADLTVVED